MKKVKFLLLLCSNIVFANDINTCDVFTNVLQTRANLSKIEMKGDANIYNSPDCKLNTGKIEDGEYYRRLFCGSGKATATGRYGSNLNDNEIFNWEFSDSQASDSVGGGSSQTITYNNENLTNDKYQIISQNYHNYSFSWSPNGNDIAVKKFYNILNNVTINNIANKDVKIGQFITKDSDDTKLLFNQIPNKIEIGTLSVSGSNGFDANWEAKESIEITEMDIKSSSQNDITLKAPVIKIAKEDKNKMDLTNDNNHIVIYADKLYIGEVDFGQHNTLEIHPYTPGQKVEVYIRQVDFSSNSQIKMDSGDYYIRDVDIPGSGDNIALMKASDENQIINLVIDPLNENHDFEIGNNFGINSNGVNGNFGNYNPANFRIFVNGDVETGGGGTTFNALIYCTGEVNLGTETYVRGAISSKRNITISNNDKFYWYDGINDGCQETNNIAYPNSYTCGIFPSGLTSYKTITVVGSNHKVYNSESIFAKTYNDNQNKLKCSVNESDSNLKNCSRIEPPKNKYEHIILSNNDNKHYTGSNKVIHLIPTNTYKDNNIKYMVAGNYEFSGSHTTVIFDQPGDYYFKELKFTGSNSEIVLPQNGIVRIFVKNNLDFSGSGMTINSENANGSNLFIYVGGDFDATGSDTQLNGFVYVKGETTLPGSVFKLYGALTSEGNINIKGSKHYFYYNNADNLGYGECPLCYDNPKVSGMIFDFGQCPGFSINISSEIEVPIKSDERVNNVSIDEAHNKSIFSFDMFNRNKVIDQDEHFVRDAEHSNNGLLHVSSLGIDASLFDDKIVTYKLGNNNYDYGPTNSNSYQQLYTYTLFGFNFCKWYDSLIYVAHYNEAGKHYDAILDKCQKSGSGGGNTDELPHIGSFDAWDTNYNNSNRNITTKIVNKDFNLTIASINENGEVSTQEPEEGEGWFSSSKDISIKYALSDNNGNNITPYEDFDASQNATIIHTFNVSKAYKDVYVQFKVCSAYNETKHKYNVYSYDSCSNECTSEDTKEEKCIRKFYSSDNFAIRPDHFEISGTGVNKAGDNLSFIAIKAVDENGNPVIGYNESSDDLNLKAIDDKVTASDLDYSFTFKNGNADIDYIKYPEVGKIKLTLLERNADEFAKVDEDDTPDNKRLITTGISNVVRVIPDHFSITNIEVNNFNNGDYTYLSDDLSMGGEVNATITAENKANNITKNYSAGLYERDVNISIPFSPDEIKNLSKIITQYGENNISDKNISFVLGEGNFSEGKLNLNLKINFDRKSGKPVNDFNLTLKELNVTDEDNATGTKTIDRNVSFRYAKASGENKYSYNNGLIKIVIHFVYYHNNNWITNKEHTKIYGDVNSTYTKEGLNVNLNEDSISNGTQSVEVDISSIKERPYKLILHLGIAPWLWYSKSNKVYKVPSSSNTDCSTHPCANIILYKKSSKHWAGVGVEHSNNDINKNTVDLNRKKNLNKQFYYRINW